MKSAGWAALVSLVAFGGLTACTVVIVQREAPRSPEDGTTAAEAAPSRTARHPTVRAAPEPGPAPPGRPGCAVAARAPSAPPLPVSVAGRAPNPEKSGFFQEKDAHGTVRRQGSYVDGKRDGLWVEWDPDGGRSETWYRAGKKHGREVAWRADGTQRFEGNYVDDQLDGVWTSWAKGGVLWCTREYVAGKVTGPMRTYHPNGTLKQESVYEDGKDVAPTRGWYEDGSLEFVMPYVDGRRQGDAVWYHRNGRVAARGRYVDGQLDGTYLSWDEDGRPLPTETWSKGRRTDAVAEASRAQPGSATK